MPTYDYTCTCGATWEEFHSMSSKIEVCPTCNCKTAQKLISRGAGVHFKGSGFYENDYKRKENKEKENKGENSK